MDQFERGFVIGITAGGIKDLFSYISYALGWTKVSYGHWMGVYLLGRPVRNSLEFIYAQGVEIGLTDILGIVFTYCILRSGNKHNLWFKGLLLANTFYFLSYVMATLYRLPVIATPDISTSLSNLVTTSVFGILLGLFTERWGLHGTNLNELRLTYGKG